ncbi:MAG: hypothetical protein HC915_21300 [Anaerolineae bacterium]|nr:hypothetical protein [Anaerolineae bacterium]
MLSFLYLATMFLSETLSNNACAAVMVPIAINLAAQLGVPYMPFVMAVLFASSLAFCTPIGYQTNTLVYSVGGYRFSDYWRLGLPVQLVVGAVAGMVLLESYHEDMEAHLPYEIAGVYAEIWGGLRRAFRANESRSQAELLADFGHPSPQDGAPFPPEIARLQIDRIRPEIFAAAGAELDPYRALLRQGPAAVPDLGGLPLQVLSCAYRPLNPELPDDLNALHDAWWGRFQNALAATSRQVVHQRVMAGHELPIEQPGQVAAVIRTAWAQAVGRDGPR